jgi:hypothetical protein
MVGFDCHYDVVVEYGSGPVPSVVMSQPLAELIKQNGKDSMSNKRQEQPLPHGNVAASVPAIHRVVDD